MFQDHREELAFLADQVHLGLKVSQDLKDGLGLQDLKVFQAALEDQDFKVGLDLQDHRVSEDHQEVLVPMDSPGRREPQVNHIFTFKKLGTEKGIVISQ